MHTLSYSGGISPSMLLITFPLYLFLLTATSPALRSCLASSMPPFLSAHKSSIASKSYAPTTPPTARVNRSAHPPLSFGSTSFEAHRGGADPSMNSNTPTPAGSLSLTPQAHTEIFGRRFTPQESLLAFSYGNTRAAYSQSSMHPQSYLLPSSSRWEGIRLSSSHILPTVSSSSKQRPPPPQSSPASMKMVTLPPPTSPPSKEAPSSGGSKAYISASSSSSQSIISAGDSSTLQSSRGLEAKLASSTHTSDLLEEVADASRRGSSSSNPTPPSSISSDLTGSLTSRSSSLNPPDTSLTPSPPLNLRTHPPDVSIRIAQQLYEDLLMGRIFEDTCAQQYYRGKIAGFVHLYTGQEAVSTGVIKALRPSDFVISTYRDHVHAISKGVPAKSVLAELYGKETGCSKGRGGSMHLFSKEWNLIGGFAFIGEQIPIALGAAFGSAYRGFKQETDEEGGGLDVAVCFLGDGTSNNGQFYEALNMASLMKLPIIFVVENNNWAIGMAAHRSTRVPEIYKKVEGFGMPGIEVDGMDVLRVRATAREAIDRARSGGGPTLIEALTYRFRGHSLADPDELRASLERKAWSERDPIVTFGNYMKSMGYATDASLKLTRDKVKAIMDEAVNFAESSPEPVIEDVAKYIMSHEKITYGEDTLTPLQLNNYAEALAEELRLKERKKAGERNPGTPMNLQENPLTVID